MEILDQAAIQEMINNEVEESLTLEYKAAQALGRTDSKKKEITKDVSAMANSAGGTIFYGIKEYDEPSKKHLPEKLDPIDRTEINREWLEQVINTIRPKIDNLIIYSVPTDTDPNKVIYVVEIPQSTTAHQAFDFRYYKRHNFQAVPMHDYEIRDVMGRSQHPKISLEFEIQAKTIEISHPSFLRGFSQETKSLDVFNLEVYATNVGNRYAMYITGFLYLPVSIVHNSQIENSTIIELQGVSCCEFVLDNTVRDVVDAKMGIIKYGPSWFDPILPELKKPVKSIELKDEYAHLNANDIIIHWHVYADNAPVNTGSITLSDIHINDIRGSNTE